MNTRCYQLILTELCTDVCIEPDLQPVMKEHLNGPLPTHGTKPRLKSLPMECGEGGLRRPILHDVRVFNPHAPSNKNLVPSICCKKHEREKKWAYKCVREVQHSSFTPVVLRVTGSLGIEATSFYKSLSSMHAIPEMGLPIQHRFIWL